jgi:hypothetical protein
MLYLSNILSASVVVALCFQYLGRLYKDGLFCREWRRNRGLKYSIEVEKSSTIRKAKLTDSVVTNIALIIVLTSPLEQ